METAPDLIGAVIGFRQFRVVGAELWSTPPGRRWDGGVQTAQCLVGGVHDEPPPGKGCSCGFYARYTPPPRGASAATPDLVAGAVALWGRIELHAHGMRAEHATVVALALPISHGAKRRRTRAAAAALGIAAVPAHRLIAATAGHGEMIPGPMRPPNVMPNKRAAPGEPRSAKLNAVADGLGVSRR
ncbi:hypothetical protein BH24ACT7_BH24ACT7_02540 [soil metagenome]